MKKIFLIMFPSLIHLSFAQTSETHSTAPVESENYNADDGVDWDQVKAEGQFSQGSIGK